MNRVREIRKLKGLTQQELAARLGISQAQIARLESGASDMTIEQMSLFAKALNCEPWELLPKEMQPNINQQEFELVKLLKALTTSTETSDTSSTKTG